MVFSCLICINVHCWAFGSWHSVLVKQFENSLHTFNVFEKLLLQHKQINYFESGSKFENWKVSFYLCVLQVVGLITGKLKFYWEVKNLSFCSWQPCWIEIWMKGFLWRKERNFYLGRFCFTEYSMGDVP